MIGHGRGGGGGFGGFPYRSPHQQDNNRSGGRRGRGRGRGGFRGRQQPKTQRSNSGVSFAVELNIPAEKRGILVGKGGSTLRWLKRSTNTNVFVPHVQQQQREWRQRQQGHEQQREHQPDDSQNTSTTTSSSNENSVANHPIRVNSNDIASLLHCFCEIISILSQTKQEGRVENPNIPCLIKMRNHQTPKEAQIKGNVVLNPGIDMIGDSLSPPSFPNETAETVHIENSKDVLLFCGTFIHHQATSSDFSATNSEGEQTRQQMLYAYAVETILSEQDVATIVDNIKFVDSAADACQWFYREVPHRQWELDPSGCSGASSNSGILAINDNASTGDVVSEAGEINNQLGDTNKKSNINSFNAQRRCLVFIFGAGSDRPYLLSSAIQEATYEAWTNTCFDPSSGVKSASALVDSVPSNVNSCGTNSEDSLHKLSISIGTYNVLHPIYARKYHDPIGLNALGRSNWRNWRAPAIAAMLQQSALDVYFLQELDSEMMKNDLYCVQDPETKGRESHRCASGEASTRMEKMGCNQLGEMYETIYFPHPMREAKDGVAIAVKKSRFTVLNATMVPYQAKSGVLSPEEESQFENEGHYMCASTAVVRDKVTGLKLLLACVHFYEKKCVHPQKTLMEYLENRIQPTPTTMNESSTGDEVHFGVDAIIWGGDCNKSYGNARDTLILDGVEYQCADYPIENNAARDSDGNSIDFSSRWRNKKKIDWLFYRVSPGRKELKAHSQLDDACIQFIKQSRLVLRPTCFPRSDHLGVAATISFRECSNEKK